ncbi:MAG: thiamine phosphate synthase [Acidimicrobiia bacterium]|nr:thiamine phosphate synthase [Acidimicrobiia bacterium]
MNLPRLLILTDRHQTTRPLVDVVRAAVNAGARAVVLREKDLPRAVRAHLADQLRPILTEAGALLIMASDATIPADGVHLATSDQLPANRPPLVGRSCHDPTGLQAAAEEGCDWATLSPIFPSPSKPGYGPALGTGALAGAPLPVCALGGVDAGRAAACVAAGAAGVAVMGAVMRATDPAAVVANLLRALESKAGR